MVSTSTTHGNIHICKLNPTCKYEHGVLNGLMWAIIIQAKIETLNVMTFNLDAQPTPRMYKKYFSQNERNLMFWNGIGPSNKLVM